ncbi:hypothetical protein [Streptomyces tibetensis]
MLSLSLRRDRPGPSAVEAVVSVGYDVAQFPDGALVVVLRGEN